MNGIKELTPPKKKNINIKNVFYDSVQQDSDTARVTRLGKFAHWVIVFFGLIEKKYI
jgi:hypothetical protein